MTSKLHYHKQFVVAGILGLATTTTVHCQNLVLNPSFETYNKEVFEHTCKFIFQDSINVEHWFATGNHSSKETHQCESKSMYISPQKLGLKPVDGNWMIGFTAIQYPKGNNQREYLVATLAEPLKAHSTYKVRLYLSPRNGCKQGVAELGIWFTAKAEASDTFNQNFSIQPQLTFNTESITQKNEWQAVELEFTAEGGETYMVIGNFKSDTESMPVILGADTKKMEYWESYYSGFYFIDAVSVVKLKSQTPGTLFQK